MSDITLRKVGKMFTESAVDDKYTFVVGEGEGSTADRDELVEALDLTDADFSIGAYERHVYIPAVRNGTSGNQPTATGVDTLAGLQFANGSTKYAYATWEVPSDWNGSDVTFQVCWFPDSGSLNGTTDTVIWDVDYRSIANGEATNNGTIESLQVTESSAITQYVTSKSQFTLDADGTNQPLSIGDHVHLRVSRNNADAFSGTVVNTHFTVVYTSVGLPTN